MNVIHTYLSVYALKKIRGVSNNPCLNLKYERGKFVENPLNKFQLTFHISTPDASKFHSYVLYTLNPNNKKKSKEHYEGFFYLNIFAGCKNDIFTVIMLLFT